MCVFVCIEHHIFTIFIVIIEKMIATEHRGGYMCCAVLLLNETTWQAFTSHSSQVLVLVLLPLLYAIQ